ncbi:MAG: transcription termination/antitermination NusG family protein [Bacteroidota bacterium]
MSELSHWYVLYTRPRNEKKVIQRLENEFEVFCPLVTTKRQWSDRKKKVSEPLFRSYVFVKVTEAERQDVLRTPGVVCYI